MLDDSIRWLHLVATSVWLGGLITLGALVGAVRAAGADRTVLTAMARRFGTLSWAALAVLVVTGILQLARSEISLRDDTDYAMTLFLKLALVGIAAGLALFHQMTARTSSPATRGIVQASILLAGLGVVAAAVTL